MLAALPFVLLVGIVIWQLVLAGHAMWMCADAARVAARADAVGEDAERAARSALPEGLESGMEVERADGGAVEVRILVPFLLHRWQTPIPVAASAHLEPGSP
jgi:pilus assembly protein CpaE